jgi:hypothetical protein
LRRPSKVFEIIHSSRVPGSAGTFCRREKHQNEEIPGDGVEMVEHLRRYIHNRTGANGVVEAIDGDRPIPVNDVINLVFGMRFLGNIRANTVPVNSKAQRGNPEELPIDSGRRDFRYVQHGHRVPFQ